MKRIVRTVVLLLVILCVSWGSVAVIYAKTSAAAATNTANTITAGNTPSVNPTMAVLAAAIAGLVGIIIFIKRNKGSK